MTKLNADLIKKYHQDLVFNYAEYPTKDHWDFSFKDENYKDALLEWLPKNQEKKIFFMFIYLSANNFAGSVHAVNLLLRIMRELKNI